MVFHDGWAWLSLGLVLIACGAWFQRRAFYAGAGVCACVALGNAMWPLPPLWQLVLAIVVAPIVVGLYLRLWFVPTPLTVTSKVRKSRQKLVGARVSLMTPIVSGLGKAQVQNAVWTVRCEKPLQQGALVEVVGHHEGELNVAPV